MTKGWDGTFDSKALNSGIFLAVYSGTLDNGQHIPQRIKSIRLIR